MSESLDWQEYLTLLLFKAKNAAYLISHFESRLALTSWVFPPGAGPDAAAWRRRTAANFLMTNPGRARMSAMSGPDLLLLSDGFVGKRSPLLKDPGEGLKNQPSEEKQPLFLRLCCWRCFRFSRPRL